MNNTFTRWRFETDDYNPVMPARFLLCLVYVPRLVRSTRFIMLNLN